MNTYLVVFRLLLFGEGGDIRRDEYVIPREELLDI